MTRKNPKKIFDKSVSIKKNICIIGAGGHGCVVADIARKNGYNNIYFIDDNKKTHESESYEIIGSTSDIDKIYQNDKTDFFIAIGNNQIRENIYKFLRKKNIKQPILIHPSAVIDPSVQIDEGTVVMANVVINANATIGRGCIINTAATVDHDCNVGNFVHISPGVHIAGTVRLGNRDWIGIGSSIINNINICEDVIVGGGTTIIDNINSPGKYVGLPIRRIKE